jgi:hypothetical protein
MESFVRLDKVYTLIGKRKLPVGANLFSSEFSNTGKALGFPEHKNVLAKVIGPRMDLQGKVLEESYLAFYAREEDASKEA